MLERRFLAVARPLLGHVRRRFTALYLGEAAKRRGAKQPCQKRWSACRLQLLQLRSRPIGCQSEPALLAARRLDRSYQFWYCAPTRSSIMTGRLPYHVKCDLLSELTEAGSGIPLLLRGI